MPCRRVTVCAEATLVPWGTAAIREERDTPDHRRDGIGSSNRRGECHGQADGRRGNLFCDGATLVGACRVEGAGRRRLVRAVKWPRPDCHRPEILSGELKATRKEIGEAKDLLLQL